VETHIYVTEFEQLIDELSAKRSGQDGWYMAKCPAHDDGKASLALHEGDDGGVALKCHAGCSYGSVARALRILPHDLSRREVCAYDYCDEIGRLLYQTVRYEPKTFRPCRPDRDVGWIFNLGNNGDVRRVLYRLPELLAAKPDVPVFFVEGEKDADNLAAIGLIATTNQGGADADWHADYSEQLRDRSIVVIPDRDSPGRRHAVVVARSLLSTARHLHVLDLPGGSKDVSDWLLDGGSATNLLDLAEVAPVATEWLGMQREEDPGQPSPRTWTVADLVNLSHEAPAKQLVDGLLAEGDRFLITAFAGVGKSLFGLDLAFALHCGTQFLGHFATTQARVGYVDEESAPARLGQRLRQVVAGRGINAEQDLPLFRVISGERLDTPAGVDQLFAWVAEHQLGVLVIDTLRRVHRLKENEADDMARIESAMKTLQGKARTELGRALTLVVLHHSPKAQSGGAETMARGSGDIIAAADGALYLRKKGADAIEVEHAKARWSGQLEPFRVLIHATDTSLRLEFAAGDAPKQSRRSELHDLIVRILTDEGDPLSRGDIVKRAARAGFKRRQTVQDELKAMVEDAQLIKEQAGRVTLYRLAPVDDDRF
jgi:hypothetical protein